MLDKKKIWRKWHILIRILPLLAFVLALKYIVHIAAWRCWLFPPYSQVSLRLPPS
jgi:hypothetical protein